MDGSSEFDTKRGLMQFVIHPVLSAQATDALINQLTPALFKAFPNMEALSAADEALLIPYINKVRGFIKKSKWILEIAKRIKKDKNIPHTLQGFTALPGIGRKSANVILREAGVKPEGVIVDLHVVRVAPRLGIALGTEPEKIEKQIMDILPAKDWDAGMAMSFLGREVCRPTDPLCPVCVMNKVCEYYLSRKS